MCCILYVDTTGKTVGRQAQLRDVNRISGQLSDDSDSNVAAITKDVKRALQLAIAHKKVSNAAAYQEEVRAAVERKEATKISADHFGMPTENIAAYERTLALIDLKQGLDISEPEVIQ